MEEQLCLRQLCSGVPISALLVLVAASCRSSTDYRTVLDLDWSIARGQQWHRQKPQEPRTVSQLITLPLIGVSGSCTILTLTLGPLDLTLLGLMVHLNQVVLNITAQPGPGNLLGNLLCDVANLLNGGNLSSTLTQLVSLINQILSSL